MEGPIPEETLDLKRLATGPLRLLPRRLADRLYRAVRRLPGARQMVEREYRGLMDELAPLVHRHRGATAAFRKLPAQGVDRKAVLSEITAIADAERPGWGEGHASGSVYHGAAEHIDFLNEVYAQHSQANPLHVDIWPSTAKFEAEIVAMTAEMLGADTAGGEICGAVTSGGTESIILAMKAYRERSGTGHPEIVAPKTAHVAFDKAAGLLGMRMIRIPVGADLRADVDAAARAVGRRTAVVVGSAPGFPHGIIDPIADLSEMARERGVGFHTDACLGGFVLPWAERLGYPVPPFDFRLPGVTSISADTHKYGYAPKGTSVVLYRGRELRAGQYFIATDWPGGIYPSPTLAGSRPGALSAAAWAAMISVGEDGYLEATRRILETAATIKAGIAEIEGLEVMGEPLWVIAFRSDDVDIYRVMDAMARRGWSLNGLQHPPALHLAVTLPHTRDGAAERFLEDLRAAVEETRLPAGDTEEGLGPVYGMAASFPARAAVGDLLERYLDLLYDA